MAGETEKKARRPKVSLDDPLKKSYAIIAVLIVCLGISVYFNLQPTAMVAADGNGGDGSGNGDTGEEREPIESPYETFDAVSGDICEENGKPLVVLFTSASCPHCSWIKDTFDAVAKEYAEDGKIVAYHWQLDTGDDTLTEDVELAMPNAHEDIFSAYSMGYVPTFVFGCKYYRIGTGYEGQWQAGELTEEEALQKEEAEYRQIIEDMLGA